MKIYSSDCTIWNVEQVVIQMVNELKSDFAKIDLNSEGPCATALGLYKLLDSLNAGGVKIVTANQLETHDVYNIQRIPTPHAFSAQHFLKTQHYSADKQITKTFGLFVGRSNWPRLFLAQHLFNNYLDRSELTFHYNPEVDYHTAHLGLDQLLMHVREPSIIASIGNLLNACPLTQDQIDSYPMLSPENFGIAKVYPNFFVEVVCETYFTGRTFFPTEKTFRPMALKTPFILQGPENYLENLRRLGFKTFNNWWSEEYDQFSGPHRLIEIRNVIDYLGSMTNNQLKELYASMRPVLEHNYKLLLSLTEDDFRKAFGYE